MNLEVFNVPAFQDNYLWILRSAGRTAVVDPGDPAAVIAFLDGKGWSLDFIWNTHHHSDHVGGNINLKKKYECEVLGPAADQARIPGIDVGVHEGDVVRLGDAEATVYFTPGHTRGHICYHFAEEKKAFVGDTLFAMGCGRLFEGTPAQMWSSLKKIRQWPADTNIYCAHEYTEANGRFARSIDPDNIALKKRMDAVVATRQARRPTIPFALGEELATNPFLRADDRSLRQALGLPHSSPSEAFAYIRSAKDKF